MATAAPPPTPVPVIDLGRVVSRGFAALRANFLPFLGMSLLLAGLPAFAIQYWALSRVSLDDPSFIFSGAYWGGILGGFVAGIIASALLQGVLVRSTILYLSGRDADLGQSASVALRLILPIIGISIVVGLLVGIGFICLIVPGIIIYCALIVAIPALVEERRGVFGSIQRSRDLTRGSRGQVFLLAILFFVFSTIISAIMGALTGISMIDFTAPPAMPDPLLSGLANGISSALSTLISAVLLSALYVELRTVKEGASTDDLATIFG